MIVAQIRLHFSTTKALAENYFHQLDHIFEDDGYPVAITEIDEHKDIHELSVYVDDSEQQHATDRICNTTMLSFENIAVETLPEIDWVSHSLAGLKPVRAGRFFVHGSHDRDKIKESDLNIEIDAGQAFGTGHHGTTAGCLEMIAKVVQQELPDNALDLGTGSGVLAIGIAMLKPIPILATDIDPIAIDVARENITLNKVDKHITTIVTAGLDHETIKKYFPFDLIVANILANPLIELAPSLISVKSDRGSIILSGILEEQHDKVLQRYTALGLTHINTFHREGWGTIHLK